MLDMESIDARETDRIHGDEVVHMAAADGRIRGLAALTSGVVEDARQRHDTYPTASAALGRTITATAMLGADLKEKQKLMTEVIGDGPLGRVVAEVDSSGAIRGYVQNPHVHLPLNRRRKLDVAGAVGSGSFYVTRDLGMREPYRGMVPLVSGEIGEDFAYYLKQSQQTPAAVALGVLVDTDNSIRASGGVVVQLMPGGAEDSALVDEIERRVESMPMVSRAIDNGVLPIELLQGILEGLEPRVIGTRPVEFCCSCSKERFGRGLIALGRDEIVDMIEEDGGAELVCHFCSERYDFSAEELYGLVAEIDAP